MSDFTAPSSKLNVNSSRWELHFVVLAMWLLFISIPLNLGRLGLSWDALNHHIYLGWMADSSRLGWDYAAASNQSYQFPYLYWPAYKLAISGFSGMTAGIILATLHLIVVPPVWMVSRTLIPARDAYGAAMRIAAVALAFMSAVPLRMLESTGNDLLAAAPFLWAVALAFRAYAKNRADMMPVANRTAFIAGLLGGISVAFKLSNGPLAILLPLLFLFGGGTWLHRAFRVALCAFAIGLGFVVTYGYWGFQLWTQFGNPIYPFYQAAFEPLRLLTGWAPP